MLENFKTSQNVAYHMILNSIHKNKISHAYLIDTNAYPKSMEFVMAFVKFLMCPEHKTNSDKCENCSICRKIDDGNHTEIKIIEPDGMWIKKEQLSELQKEFSTKSVEGQYRIYIIHHAEKLNPSSANSILKFLEEPEEGIIAILVTDNLYQLLDTVISRCQIISLKQASTNEIIESIELEDSDLLKIGMSITSTLDDLKEFVANEKNQKLLDVTINFIEKYERNGKDALLYTNKILELCKDRVEFSYVFDLMILFYQDMIQSKLNRKLHTFAERKEQIERIIENKTVLTLCQKLNILIELKEEIKYNVNQSLLLDRLILELEEIAV